MENASTLVTSLDLASDRMVDPTDAIYAHLFDKHADLERLFIMDTDGGVRGSMLQQAFDCLIDLTGDGALASVILSAERANHETYDVPDDLFMSLFDAIKHIIQQTLGSDWTQGMEADWAAVLKQADALSRSQ